MMDNKFSGAGANTDSQNDVVPSGDKFNRPSTKSSLTPLKERNCLTEESNLPSKNYAELWEKPLKFTGSLPSNSPKCSNAARRSKSKVARTPSGSRRNVLPPMKLFPDQSDTDESPSLKQQRLAYRRSLSYPSESSTPITYPKRQKLFSDEISPYEELNSKTIPESTGTEQDLLDENSSTLTPLVKKLFSKSQSDSILTSCNVKRALEQIENNPNLIGDGSRSHILPLKVDGKHPDLKEITGESLAKLLEGVQSTEESVKFKIIDCRYPYEYEGGHIRGAVNFYTKKQVREQLLEVKLSLEMDSNICKPERERGDREILIFHCEFSSHRGPALYRYLRDIDRATNASSYPFLFFPEIYVLYGGYQTFFEKYPNHCEPQAYVKMTDQEHGEQYRRFKSECKFGLS